MSDLDSIDLSKNDNVLLNEVPNDIKENLLIYLKTENSKSIEYIKSVIDNNELNKKEFVRECILKYIELKNVIKTCFDEQKILRENFIFFDYGNSDITEKDIKNTLYVLELVQNELTSKGYKARIKKEKINANGFYNGEINSLTLTCDFD